MNKPWKDLQFIKEIRIKPEDPKKPMWVDFAHEADYERVYDSCVAIKTWEERSIKLGANAMYETQMDYPEDFKKLVVATGDLREAYDLYRELQKPLVSNWQDYANGVDVW